MSFLAARRGTSGVKLVPPPPPAPSSPDYGDDPYSDDRPPSNNGHGADDAHRVTQILEEHAITCCFVGISALIFYGVPRTRPDWEICVPTELTNKAAELFQSEPYSSDYMLVDSWPDPSSSLIHTYKRFKGRGFDLYFILVPSNDAHMECNPLNITRSVRGLPFPKLDVFIQSSLDARNQLQLCDVVDGTDIAEQWGENNLKLDGTNDTEWAKEITQRGKDFAGEKFAYWGPFAAGYPRSRRDMWQSVVRTKEKRLDCTKPKEVFITQYRIVDTPDSWTVLSDAY